jgi:hypothetical protein
MARSTAASKDTWNRKCSDCSVLIDDGTLRPQLYATVLPD